MSFKSSVESSASCAALLLALACAAPAHAQLFVPVANPVWTGPYAGIFGGYGSGGSAQHDNGFVFGGGGGGGAAAGGGGGVAALADGAYGLSGGLGGALVGYSTQLSTFVVGLEGDIAAAHISGASAACGTPAHVCGTTIDAAANVRGRIGYAIGGFLPYVAGGLAIDDIRAYDNLLGVQGASWRAGYTIGGGIEYKIMPNVALRVEYLYSDFGTAAQFQIVPGVPERISAHTNVVRVGATFGLYDVPAPAPVVAKY